jgi:hypothetical protein
LKDPARDKEELYRIAVEVSGELIKDSEAEMRAIMARQLNRE